LKNKIIEDERKKQCRNFVVKKHFMQQSSANPHIYERQEIVMFYSKRICIDLSDYGSKI